MPPLSTDSLAGEIGAIIADALKAHERKLSLSNIKGDPDDLFAFVHEDDFEDIIFEASDKAADLITDRLCTFNPAHDPATCQLCK